MKRHDWSLLKKKRNFLGKEMLKTSLSESIVHLTLKFSIERL